MPMIKKIIKAIRQVDPGAHPDDFFDIKQKKKRHPKATSSFVSLMYLMGKIYDVAPLRHQRIN